MAPVLLLVLGAGLFLSGCEVRLVAPPEANANGGGSEESAQLAITAVVDGFLRDVDTGTVEGTWSSLGTVLQQQSTEQVWADGIRSLRSTAGAVITRTRKSVRTTNDLPSLPAGEYAGVAFDTKFAGLQAEERVVLQKEGNRWKIIGYFLAE